MHSARYDLAFSLGYDCNASLALRRAGLQFYSYPFDWLTRAALAARADLLARRFEGWLDSPGGLDDLGPVPFERFAPRHRVVVDRASGLEFRHDFPLALPVADALPEVAAKYRRRADRLLESIGRADRVLAVFAVGFRRPDLAMEELVAARRVLAAAFGDKVDVLGLADDAPGGPDRPPAAEEAEGGRVRRVSLRCLSETPQGIEVSDRALAEFLRAQVEVPDPRTPGEKRAHRELVRRREYAKYAARTRLGMFWNKLQYRRWRALSKALQRKGILPPNEPGAPR